MQRTIDHVIQAAKAALEAANVPGPEVEIFDADPDEGWTFLALSSQGQAFAGVEVVLETGLAGLYEVERDPATYWHPDDTFVELVEDGLRIPEAIRRAALRYYNCADGLLVEVAA